MRPCWHRQSKIIEPEETGKDPPSYPDSELPCCVLLLVVPAPDHKTQVSPILKMVKLILHFHSSMEVIHSSCFCPFLHVANRPVRHDRAKNQEGLKMACAYICISSAFSTIGSSREVEGRVVEEATAPEASTCMQTGCILMCSVWIRFLCRAQERDAAAVSCLHDSKT